MAGCCSNPKVIHHENVVDGDQTPDAGEGRSMQWFRIGVALLIAGQAMIFSLAVNITPPEGVVRLLIHGVLAISAVIVVLVAGLPLFRESFSALRKGKIVVEQLFLLGIAGAFFGSLLCTFTGKGDVYYEVVAILVAIYSFNILLSESRRRKSIAAARSLRAQFARCRVVTCCGDIEEKPVGGVRVGEKVRVSAGEGIPVDGIIKEGVAFVQETGMTGEPYPVVKRPGDRVMAGTICVDSSLTIEAVKDGSHRELDTLLKIVEEARFKPSGIQTTADRMVSWFLPVVATCSMLTFLGWTWFVDWQIGLFNAMAVLIVACPCAMGLATPIGIWSAISALAKRGLVVYSGEFIERVASVDTVIFDKTGTLSDDNLQIEEMVTAPGVSREELISMIAFLEGHSHHPIARAFQSLKPGSSAQDLELIGLETIPGKGIEGRICRNRAGIALAIGNADLLAPEMKVTAAQFAAQRHSRDEEQGSLALHVLVDGSLAGMIWLRETARGESAQAAQYLKDSGIRTLVMSGDKVENIRRLKIPVDGVRGGMTPQEKAAALAEMQKAGHKALFVGDGANDAPALSVAHAGIAMGGGASLADESAQATLFGGNLLQVVDAICLSRLVVKRIRSNILFAFCYNVTGITLAMLGLIHPVAAAVLMLVSSATVSWRAFRLGEDIQDGHLQRFRNLLAEPVCPPRKISGMTRDAVDLLRRNPVAALLAFLFAAQGPLLAYLAQLDFRWSALTATIFLLLAVVGFILCSRRQAGYTLRACFGMLAVGNLAMIAGWWADAGFGAVVRDGICLCGCEKSIMGKGLLANFNLMHLGMIAGGIPGMAFGNPLLPRAFHSGFLRVTHLLSCLAGMYLGMMLGASLMSLIPVGNPHVYMVCSFFTMTTGMLLGMMAVCTLWFKFQMDGRVSLR